MEHLFFLGYVIVSAFIFARLEIQIEGPHGWAANLPTWRISNWWTKWFYGGRPLTGYHLWMQVLVIVLVHAPAAMQPATWSKAMELKTVAFIILFFIVEDFLWFVLNPAYGLRRFRREHIWWHKSSWWWVMPRDYWVFTFLGSAMYLISSTLR